MVFSLASSPTARFTSLTCQSLHPNPQNTVSSQKPFFGCSPQLSDRRCTDKAQPILSLSIPDTSCTCLDWASHDRLIVGCENGHIAVFDVGASLSSDEANCPPVKRPSFYIPSHEGALRSVKAVRNPPADVDGQVMDDHEPHVIMSTGYDGGHCLVDLRDVHTGNTIARLRSAFCDSLNACA